MIQRGNFTLEGLLKLPPEPEKGVLVEYGPRETKKATWHSPTYAPGRWPTDQNGNPIAFAKLSLYAQAYFAQSYANQLNQHLSSKQKAAGGHFYIREVGESIVGEGGIREDGPLEQMVVYYPTKKGDKAKGAIKYPPIGELVNL